MAVVPESGRVRLADKVEVREMAVVPESGRVQFEEDMKVVGRWCGLRVGMA
ncbi:hypothetical protein DPMN_097949 [Dreissena polymorpha]|uniref:Uncharacterized protein n=1 Tax=Dreissena polymorpha TaxID=45954 RepID=A0A9D4LB62_DREPO|nr:hypothetical protein DPMN_097949 [Dreissena polymorpha]